MQTDIDVLIKELQRHSTPEEQTHASYHQLVNSIADHINEHLLHDFPRFVQLLYRLDISEAKVRELLRDGDQPANILIAQLIIERELQKARLKASFKKKNDIPEDEKW